MTNHSEDDWGPVGSPDGRQIVFLSDRDGQPDVYVMNRDGSQQQRLTRTPAQEWGPVWSPDSQHLLFVTTEREDLFLKIDIHLTDPDGSGQTLLVDDVKTSHWSVCNRPVWSPDSQQIAYIETIGPLDENGEVEQAALNLVRLDGGRPTRLLTWPGQMWDLDW